MTAVMHDAIIVTSWDSALLLKAHTLAKIVMLHVTDIIPGVVNGYTSFMVAPDGSKEGWAESDKADEDRAAFIEWLDANAYDDGSNKLEYVVVRFGDNEVPKVTSNNYDASVARGEAEIA